MMDVLNWYADHWIIGTFLILVILCVGALVFAVLVGIVIGVLSWFRPSMRAKGKKLQEPRL